MRLETKISQIERKIRLKKKTPSLKRCRKGVFKIGLQKGNEPLIRKILFDLDSCVDFYREEGLLKADDKGEYIIWGKKEYKYYI